MERQENIARPNFLKKKLATRLQTNTGVISIIIIVLFHLVGLIGLSITGLRDLFVSMVPWHTLLMFLLILINSDKEAKTAGFLLLIFILGFTAEWFGVHTGWIFGNYGYGKTLGIKLLNIPLLIGINWFVLVYSSGVLMQKLRLRNLLLRILSGASMLVFLDLLIEPVAMRLDYWHWANNHIPLTNYLGWFVVSALLLYIFERFNFSKQSSAGPVLLVTQFIFFAVLNFTL